MDPAERPSHETLRCLTAMLDCLIRVRFQVTPWRRDGLRPTRLAEQHGDAQPYQTMRHRCDAFECSQRRCSHSIWVGKKVSGTRFPDSFWSEEQVATPECISMPNRGVPSMIPNCLASLAGHPNHHATRALLQHALSTGRNREPGQPSRKQTRYGLARRDSARGAQSRMPRNHICP